MSFKSILGNIGSDLKKFFTSPVVSTVITGGFGIADLIDPALSPLFNGIAASVSKAEALAAAANVTGKTGPQKLALALADAQASFQVYCNATGVTIESAQQTAIINAVVAMLNSVPSSSTLTVVPIASASPAVSVASVAVAPSPTAAAPAVAPVEPAAVPATVQPAAPVELAPAASTVTPGPGLGTVVPA
jgi:hypothetical protein